MRGNISSVTATSRWGVITKRQKVTRKSAKKLITEIQDWVKRKWLEFLKDDPLLTRKVFNFEKFKKSKIIWTGTIMNVFAVRIKTEVVSEVYQDIWKYLIENDVIKEDNLLHQETKRDWEGEYKQINLAFYRLRFQIILHVYRIR